MRHTISSSFWGVGGGWGEANIPAAERDDLPGANPKRPCIRGLAEKALGKRFRGGPPQRHDLAWVAGVLAVRGSLRKPWEVKEEEGKYLLFAWPLMQRWS